MEKIANIPKYRGEPKFTNMNVVILPGKDDMGGPPTYLEIEQIENRYQLQGEAEAVKLFNEAANTCFIGNAQLLRKLETLEKSLMNNAKIVIPSGTELVNVIGEMSGVMPLTK